jgi:hypothetical protein
MKKYIYAALALPVVALVAWISLLEGRISRSVEVRVAASGYDPVDPFRGRYVWLGLDWDKTDCAQFPDGKCPKESFKSSYKFYLNETRADKVDRRVRAADGKKRKVELLFFYSPESAPMVKSLLLDGNPYDARFEGD